MVESSKWLDSNRYCFDRFWFGWSEFERWNSNFRRSRMFLFVPIPSSTDSTYLNSAILTQNNLLCLIHRMLSINGSTRIRLSDVRSELNRIRINSQIRLNTLEINQIKIISTMNMSTAMESYIRDLDHISWVSRLCDIFHQCINRGSHIRVTHIIWAI